MGLPGTRTWAMTRDDIIKSARRKLGKAHMGNDRDFRFDDAKEALNVILHSWHNEGFGLYLTREGVLHLSTTAQVYDLSATTTDHWTDTSNTTSLATTVSSGSQVKLAASGIAVSDNIGIKMDNNKVHWTTINALATDNVTASLTTAIATSCASGAPVFYYTSKTTRPIEIFNPRTRATGGEDTPITIYDRNDYQNIYEKDSTDTPNGVYYDAQFATGKLYVWPVSDDSTLRLAVDFKIPVQDVGSATQLVHVPQEGMRALIWSLAAELAPEYDLDPNRHAVLEAKAAEHKSRWFGHEQEFTSVYFTC